MGLNHKLEKRLYQKGFVSPEIRRMVMAQIYLCLGSLLFALAAGWTSSWALFFAAGAVLATYNFYHLSLLVQRIVYVTDNPVTQGLIRYYARLALTGAALYFLIIWAQASVSALVAGLSTMVAVFSIWALSRVLGHKVKEA